MHANGGKKALVGKRNADSEAGRMKLGDLATSSGRTYDALAIGDLGDRKGGHDEPKRRKSR